MYYIVSCGNLDSLYPSTWLPSIGWLNVYGCVAYIIVKRKKATHFVEYAVYICNAHGIIKSHRFSILWGEVYTLGDKDVILTLHFSCPCRITIMTLLAPNYDINMTSFPCHMLGWGLHFISRALTALFLPIELFWF